MGGRGVDRILELQRTETRQSLDKAFDLVTNKQCAQVLTHLVTKTKTSN